MPPACRQKNFSLCLDTGHTNHASKKPLTEWLDILAPWITHLHLHDNHGVIDEHLAIGAGNIPGKESIKNRRTSETGKCDNRKSERGGFPEIR